MTYCPFVSVIIPAFNAEDSIGSALDSLLVQSYGRENFEIILVDNNSFDKTASIAASRGVKVLNEKKNQCSYAARNKGILNAKGSILAFMDADCIPAENWILSAINEMRHQNADLAGGNIAFVFSDNPGFGELYDSVANLQMSRVIKNRGVGMTANLFVKRDVFNKIGLFPAGINSGGDIYFTAKASASGFELVYAEKAVVYHPARSLVGLIRKAKRTAIGKCCLKDKMLIDESIMYRIKGRSIRDHLFPKIIIQKSIENFSKNKIGNLFEVVLVHYVLLFVGFYYYYFNQRK
jgi:glycosyltransferase involved in cell wall biosynthesis